MTQVTLNNGSVDSAGSLVLKTNGTTTAVTIDTSQNVGIGTSSPAGRLDVKGTANGTQAIFTNVSGRGLLVSTQSVAGTDDAGSVLNARGATSGTLIFQTDSTERARIDSSGNLLVGTTSQLAAAKQCLQFDGSAQQGFAMRTTYATLGSTYFTFQNSAGTQAGFISQNGTTTVSYSTSSDYRLKDNPQPMQNALETVAQLKPCTYTWKSDGSAGQGFIAHELQAVVPDCVTGEKDAVDENGNPVYQGIDTSFLVATLTAAIQEQQAQISSQAAVINNLTERLAALEAK